MEGYILNFLLVIGILGLKELLDAKGSIPVYIKYISYLLYSLFIIDGIFLVNNEFSVNLNLVLLTLLVSLFPLLMFHNDRKYNIEDAFYLFSSIIFLSIVFNLFVIVREMSLYLIIYLFLITTMTDTFAYFGGSKFGKNKLLPSISPNKTVEGFAIGLTLFYYFAIGNTNVVLLIILTAVLSIVGQFGDLVFSAIKRHYKLKDFSNIMPGHGGILDRLDSIIFVLMVFIILIKYF